ncbi:MULTISPECIES: MDR family MFS transporter [Bacillaceae]|uniref:DHA2 family efflux MFS transporter permease subunit n=1 Tax=Evansella alkalicola TaxID=745819 RepID=A0ABS6JSD5_9BACI|nr:MULTISPECIES: MDR family MFS transporter [Bacillaceae]MBU9721475.1 DHA2 family efflux MFS transporter permease subunit [Bacillus alkalicola]
MTSTSQDFNRKLIVTLLLSGTFIAILNQTLMITAIPPIMHEMNITPNTAQWLTTVFMLVNGIMIPISAFFIEKYTTRQLFMTAMGLFTLGTVIGALAPNFEVLLLARIIQSAGAGILLPLMQTVFLMIFPVNKRGAAMGLVGLVISFAPAIGPALSGWILINYSWRVLFIFILPIAILAIIVSYFKLVNVTDLKNPKVDVPSIIMSSFGFGGLLYGFTSAGNNGWGSIITIVTIGIGVISLTLFILRQLRMEKPMLEFRVFKYKVFAIATILGMIGFLGLIGLETLIPLYMQNMRGFTPMEAGLAILPGALVSGFMSPITGRIFDKVGAKWLSIIGLIIMTLSSLPFSFLSTNTSFTFIAVMFALRMFGFSMVMMPVTTAGLNQLPRRLIPHGAAMNNTMRQVSASIGTAILVTVMTTTALTAENSGTIPNPDIFGANIAFAIITGLSFLGIFMAFSITKTSPEEEVTENS